MTLDIDRYRTNPPVPLLTVEPEALAARSLRRGILISMRRIREQLMVRGEWDDPTIPDRAWLEKAIGRSGYNYDNDLYTRAMHEHSVRWTVRQVRTKQTAQGLPWN